MSTMSAPATPVAPARLVKSTKCFGGQLHRFQHTSDVLGGCVMHFHAFLPGGEGPFPVLLVLSGLTCTDENFVIKSGAQRYAAEHRVALVCPDTSPRGPGPHAEALSSPACSPSWDLGLGAGYYVDATEEPYRSAGFQMRSYVAEELPAVLRASASAASSPSQAQAQNGGEGGGAGAAAPAAAAAAAASPVLAALDLSSVSIMGHSMGGMGALSLALSRPGHYRSVSALAPISHPSAGPWGVKALTAMLSAGGRESGAWARYDPTELARSYPEGAPAQTVLIDQGSEDEFLRAGQLRPDEFAEAAGPRPNLRATVNMREGYDHGFFFVMSFVGDHIAHHAKHLHGARP